MLISEQFQTPIDVARLMASHIPYNARKILEPTKGEGILVRAIVDEMEKRTTCNILYPDDLFALDPLERFDCIVMNPPFSEKYADLSKAPKDYLLKGMNLGYKILLDCMDRSDNVIALMPWFTLINSQKRLDHIMKYGLKKIIHLPRRTFPNSRIQTCVMVLQKGYNGDTTFNYIK